DFFFFFSSRRWHTRFSRDWSSDVCSSDLPATAAVVAPTRSGTVLIGSSRERVGFDPAYSSAVLRRLAAQAVALFPFLARVRVVRSEERRVRTQGGTRHSHAERKKVSINSA